MKKDSRTNLDNGRHQQKLHLALVHHQWWATSPSDDAISHFRPMVRHDCHLNSQLSLDHPSEQSKSPRTFGMANLWLTAQL